MTSCWLVCREPVHIGGADSSSRGNNNPVYRLPDRTPAIPGSSLRGALREGAEHNPSFSAHVPNWFGGNGENENNMLPGRISLGWGWPVWWPVHVLGYGNWWVSCPSWINRFQQLSHDKVIDFERGQVYVTDQKLAGEEKNIYLRWLKLSDPQHYSGSLPTPGEGEVPSDRCLILPDESINVIVDMGMVHQPRVSLRDEPDKDSGSLVKNLFAVEGFPPGAVFMVNCAYRKEDASLEKDKWEQFLAGEHFLGGLWGAGYGKIDISLIPEN
jgi:CRISPR/Cas system CMR subunit Cmr4 (Cas7 group RAMP superfamily)